MSSPYQEFARKARERFQERQKRKASGVGGYIFTLHAQYKMKQYGLSKQRVRSVIRNPRRREEGIVPKTVAVMQPVSPKKIDNKPARIATPARMTRVSVSGGPRLRNVAGREAWKQEIWVMYQVKNSEYGIVNRKSKIHDSLFAIRHSAKQQLRIISAWRYPGMSPKRNPIPEEILRELEEGSIIEPYEDNSF